MELPTLEGEVRVVRMGVGPGDTFLLLMSEYLCLWGELWLELELLLPVSVQGSFSNGNDWKRSRHITHLYWGGLVLFLRYLLDYSFLDCGSYGATLISFVATSCRYLGEAETNNCNEIMYVILQLKDLWRCQTVIKTYMYLRMVWSIRLLALGGQGTSRVRGRRCWDWCCTLVGGNLPGLMNF